MSSEIVLTEEQRAVVACDEPAFVVAASAGSGKTRVLVERYLRLVEEGVSPDRILCITFTKKAASEMKRRIVDTLRARGRDAEAQIAETGPISTFHSFCERLLRENALEARLDVDFTLLSDRDTRRLIEATVKAALEGGLEDAPYARGLVRRITGRPAYRQGPYDRLLKAVRHTLERLRGDGLAFDALAEAYRDPASFSEFASHRVRTEWGLNLCGGLIHERLETNYRLAGEKLPPKMKDVTPDVSRGALEDACGLVQITLAAWRNLETEMAALGALDFTALEARALRLLEESETVRRRVRDRLAVAMVDETQDMNPIQHRLVRALGLDGTMMVGDAQQSIYGFRLADVGLFHDLERTRPTLGLTANWRSEPGILRFVDAVFGRRWPERYRPMAPAAPPAGPPHEGVETWEVASGNEVAEVASLLADAIQRGEMTESGTAVLVRGNDSAERIVRALRARGVRARVEGGSARFYVKLEIRDVANALRAAADPDDDFAMLATLRGPFCALSLDAVVEMGALENVGRAYETFAPEGAADRDRLEAFREWFGPFRDLCARVPAWEAIAHLAAEGRAYEAFARRPQRDQRLANVRKLLTMAAARPEALPLEFAEEIAEIARLQHKEGEAEIEDEETPVVVTTIHKAKGLEWDNVIVCEMAKMAVLPADEFLTDPGTGVVATRVIGDNLLYQELKRTYVDRQTAEAQRLMYVALTRARRRLCLVLPRGKTANQATLQKWILEATRTSDPGGGVRFRTSATLGDTLGTA